VYHKRFRGSLLSEDQRDMLQLIMYELETCIYRATGNERDILDELRSTPPVKWTHRMYAEAIAALESLCPESGVLYAD
jgi:hypothetical protein